MKKIIAISMFLFCAANINCLAEGAQTPPVYLKVNSVTVSSFDATPDWAPPQNPKATIDGDKLTRWSSNYTDNQWISFDFGSPRVLSKIILCWEKACAVDYDILISDDNQNWKTLQSLKDRQGGDEEIEFAPVKTRFVKILGVKRATEFGISLWETLFFGPAKDNPQDKPLSEVYPQLANQLAGKEAAVTQAEPEKPLPSPGALTLQELQKGVVYTSWGSTELGTVASDQTLEYLKQLGVRNLAIMIVWVQDTNEEKVIYTDPKDTPEDKALIHAINKAHSLGLKVMLKPHVDIKTGQARIDIIPSKEWFASYKAYLMHYARLAGLYNVEALSIGTELVNTTMPNWQSTWEDIIKEIRGVFPGPLVYDANWDEYQAVGFWDKLDFIGIDAYFPLTGRKDPTKEELASAWKGIADNIDKWLKEKQFNKPVIFTEIGYCSAAGTNITPWSDLSKSSESSDEQEQADAIEAMLKVCPTYPWFKGFYLWSYFPQERWSPLGYIIRGKKAEAVLSDWLKNYK